MVSFIKGRCGLKGAALLVVLSGCGQNTLPECDSPETLQRVAEIINANLREAASDNPLFASALRESGLHVGSVSDGKTIYADDNTRACIGTQHRQDGKTASIGYTIQWLNRQSNEAIVEIENAGSLKRRFGKAEAPQEQPRAEPEPAHAEPQPTEQPPAQSSATEAAPERSQAFSDCTAASTRESQYADCAANEYAREDSRLNQLYRALMGKSPASDGLRAEQRAWIKARDAACEQYLGDDYPSAEHPLCMADETRHRADELAAMLGSR